MKKRGDVLIPQITFIIFNLILISGILFFISTSKTNVSLYEQSYAKEISLLISKAEPFTTIKIPFGKALEVAEEKNADIDKIFFIDNENDKVTLALSFVSQSTNKGYSYPFISSYVVNAYIDKENKFLVLNIDEK